MALLRLSFLSLLAVCAAGDAGSSLRGSSAVPVESTPQAESAAAGEGQVIGCSCGPDGVCQCNRGEPSGTESEEDAAELEFLEEAVRKRTEELSAWWHSQNETTRLMQPWSGSLESEGVMNETSGLWVVAAGGRRWRAGGVGVRRGRGVVAGCRRVGGCGCIGRVGCGCAGRRSCGVAVR